MGGRNPFTTSVANSESYNGSTWTNTPALNTARHSLAAAGTQTSSLAFGGSTAPGGALRTSTESYNGSSWTSVNSMNGPARYALAGAGIQTAALAFGGYGPSSDQSATESWNGTSWTSVNSMNTARQGRFSRYSNSCFSFGWRCPSRTYYSNRILEWIYLDKFN
jgi:hypothetical protein